VSAGHGDPALTATGSNPYGVAAPARADGAERDAYLLAAARALGLRLCGVTERLATGAGPAPATRHNRVTVLYHPGDGTHELAATLARGALAEGAEVRLRRIGEPPAATGGAEPDPHVPLSTVDDLEWADGIALGGPARIGTVAPRLLQFIEDCEPLRAAGKLDGKAATGFVTTVHPHGGSETALLALYNAMHHWGTVVVPPGYTDPVITAAGGNPYGISYTTASGPHPDRASLDAALFQGGRLARLAARLALRLPVAR
jgi:NAD(P)H dehydrogenase (quinone)